MTNITFRRSASAVAACASLCACATQSSSVQVVSQASGSPYFSLGPPGVSKAGDGVRLVGRVCRRSRTTLLTPYRVRIEHVGPGGAVIGVEHARIPPIYAYSDQACATYAIVAKWTLAPGDSLRACFDRGRDCPSSAAAKAVVAVPAS
ncbi:MAG TPA: hypothetical protein VIJ59_09930 [Caulobacteraceae bacterium]